METIRIATLDVSRIALGTWSIGGWMWGGSDDRDAVRTVHRALDEGITLIDTAPVYGMGHAEELVGAALAEIGAHDRVVLATKLGLEWDDEGNVRRNSSPERVRREVDDSLRRLRTDVIHLEQVHWPDPAVPIEDTAAELDKLRDEGKILALGVSNFSPEQMKRFRAVTTLGASQPPYNLFERGIDEDVLPYCRDTGIGVLAYGALCRGLLSGTISAEREFTGDDLRQHDPKFQPPRFERYLEAVDRLDRLARERYDRSVLELAIRWLLDRPGVSAALWGARRPEQLDAVPGVDGWSLDADGFAAIDAIISATIDDPVGPEFMAPPEE